MTSPPAGRILVAPDKFTGTLSAPLVVAHAAAGLRVARPGAPVIETDGGDLGQPSTCRLESP
jgi:glycerate kinase